MSDTVEAFIMLALGFGLGWLGRWGYKRGYGEARFETKDRTDKN